MTNINPIRFGVSSNQYFKNEEKEDLTKNSENAKKTANEGKKSIDSKEVLGFMAAQNTDILPTKTKKTLDVSKYVNEEQTQRIKDFMATFEADYNEASEIAMNEFPDLSQEAAGNIALAYINASYS